MSFICKVNLLQAIFKFKCPSCRQGDLFRYKNPYRLRHLNKMYERCSNCNLKYSIEPGFYQGAAYVSYALQVLNSLIIFNLLFWFDLMHWKSIIYIILLSILVVTPYVVVLSRCIWLYLFIPNRSKKNESTHQ